MEDEPVILQHGGGWPTNIGNGFIDYGSMYSIEEATGTEPHVTSSYGHWVSQQMTRGPIDVVRGEIGSAENHVNIPGISAADYVVQSGTCLSSHWFETYGDSLFSAKNGGAEIILYGVGMTDDSYSDKEINKTKEWVEKLDPYILVSRDEETYQAFGDLAEKSYNGIDCGFYVSESYDPMPYDEEFIAVNFDKRPEPNHKALGINDASKVIRPHHSFWLDFNLKEFRKMYNEYYNRDNIFLSDIPSDYLDVYANANQTYADRVHACVATLAYGNRAHLSHTTPRSLLFERVGMGDVTDRCIEPDLETLSEEKEAQIEFMSNAI